MKTVLLLEMLAAILTELDQRAEGDYEYLVEGEEDTIHAHGATITKNKQGVWELQFNEEYSMLRANGYSHEQAGEQIPELAEGKEVRDWHMLQWNPSRADEPSQGTRTGNPEIFVERRAFNHREGLVEFAWVDPAAGLSGSPLVAPPPPWLHVAGWDRERVLDVFMSERSKHLGEAS